MKILVRFNGKEVLMRASTARALVRRGQATRVAVDVTEQVIEAIEAPHHVEMVVDTAALKGAAKLAWLREEIRNGGGEPRGTTIASLESQLRILKSMGG